jgi:hypothetical protein
MEEIKSSPKRSIQHEEQGSKRICLDDQVEMRFLIASKVTESLSIAILFFALPFVTMPT